MKFLSKAEVQAILAASNVTTDDVAILSATHEVMKQALERNQKHEPRYMFRDTPDRPGYIDVLDRLLQQVVSQIPQEMGVMVAMMYENQLNADIHAANEMMWGYNLGVTHALLHADKLPKVQITDNGNGSVDLKMTLPDGTTQQTTQTLHPGRPAVAEAIAKAGIQKH